MGWCSGSGEKEVEDGYTQNDYSHSAGNHSSYPNAGPPNPDPGGSPYPGGSPFPGAAPNFAGSVYSEGSPHYSRGFYSGSSPLGTPISSSGFPPWWAPIMPPGSPIVHSTSPTVHLPASPPLSYWSPSRQARHSHFEPQYGNSSYQQNGPHPASNWSGNQTTRTHWNENPYAVHQPRRWLAKRRRQAETAWKNEEARRIDSYRQVPSVRYSRHSARRGAYSRGYYR